MFINHGGLVYNNGASHFSTSEETAYPKQLTQAIAAVFAKILMSHGWSPPNDQLQDDSEASLKKMRAFATVQPKVSKMPPVVREHKQVVLVKGPFFLFDISACGTNAAPKDSMAYTLFLSLFFTGTSGKGTAAPHNASPVKVGF